MGYTLKLDLSTYQRDALVTLVKTEIERGERAGTTESPWHAAMVEVADQVFGYESAVAEAKRFAASD